MSAAAERHDVIHGLVGKLRSARAQKQKRIRAQNLHCFFSEKVPD